MRGSRLALAAVVIVAALAAAYHYRNGGFEIKGGDAGAAPAPAPQAMPVPVTAVVRKTIPIYLDYSARTEAIRDVTLRAKVSGYISSQAVADGSDVQGGDLLYRIDARDYQAVLDQSKAQVERDEASLAYLRSNLTRGNELATTGYLDKDSFDQRQSAVHQAEAAVAMSKAAVQTAEINLAYTEIRAPFAGRLGRNLASEGTLVSNTTGTPLNNLVQLSPIYVSFNPSEAELADIQKARTKGKVEAEVLLPGDKEPRYRGDLTFINNTVEGNTGTVVARATIDNKDLTLLPGQYVRVRLKIRDEPNVMMVPETALLSSQLGKYVYVVGKGDTVEQRLVTLGPTSGDLIGLASGVSEGDQIIAGNLQKIFPGAPVKPMPAGEVQK